MLGKCGELRTLQLVCSGMASQLGMLAHIIKINNDSGDEDKSKFSCGTTVFVT